jgi:hypothetical protein
MSAGFVFFWVLWIILAMIIGQKKNIPMLESALWGLLGGLIAVVVLLCIKPRLPQGAVGTYTAKCVRCGAVQHVPQPEFTCWQCQTVQHVGGSVSS